MELYYYVQLRGILSLVLSFAGALLLLTHYRAPNRTQVVARVFVMAVFALWLAAWTWTDVSAIQVDRQPEIEEARLRRKEAEKREADEQAEKARQERVKEMSRVEFAEQTDADRKLLADAAKPKPGATNATATTTSGKSIGPRAGTNAATRASGARADGAAVDEAATDEAPQEYVYRRRGRQLRDEGKQDKGAITEAVEEAVAEEVVGRLMSEADAAYATRVGRFLHSFARTVFYAALLLGLTDYVLRFNATWDAFLPLPFALLGLDRARRKTMVARVAVTDRAALAPWLRGWVQRGHSFLYFGDEDPIDEAIVPRLTVGRYTLLPTPKSTATASIDWHGPEYLWETAWFNRGCGVVPGVELGHRVLADVLALMQLRHLTHARTWQTTLLVWDHEQPPPPEVLAELLRVSTDLNVKLVFLRTRFEPDTITLEENHATWPVRRPYPELYDHLLVGPVPDAVADVVVRAALGLREAVIDLLRELRHPTWRRVKQWPRALWRRMIALWGFLRWVGGLLRTGAVAVRKRLPELRRRVRQRLTAGMFRTRPPDTNV